MKKIFFALVLILFAFGLAMAIHETKPAETQAVMPPGDATKLYDYLKQAPYRSWKMWPGKKKLYKGTEPHGALLTTYVNEIAIKAIKSKTGILPDGSIIVKENYDQKKKLKALTVMYKIKGFSPDTGDWFWAKYSPDGKVEAEGKVKGCIDCHSKKKENDYIFTGPVGKPKSPGY